VALTPEAPRWVAISLFVRDRRLVLVLDNCEHVIEAAATLAVAILRGAADVHIVATSREPMKDGRRLGQSGRYAGLAPAEYIVSADSSCLMHQRGCAERIGVSIKFIHIAQILNGAAE
jgi:hypothetical protein